MWGWGDEENSGADRRGSSLGRLTLVPLLPGRPKPLNQPAPLRTMVGHTATVSTLVTVVGQPKRPTLAGNGGLRRGLPWRPSSDSISAVSSPQM